MHVSIPTLTTERSHQATHCDEHSQPLMEIHENNILKKLWSIKCYRSICEGLRESKVRP